MMPYLMTEVTEERAIRFTHIVSAAFALDIIGFGERNCDDAVLMPGHDLLSGHVSEKVEDQPVLRVFCASSQRQAPAQERIKQSVLRDLKLPPQPDIVRYREVRHGTVVTAGNTIPARLAVGHQPIADILVGVSAEETRSSIPDLYS